MILLLTIIFLVFGLIIGSFLNVVILRSNTKKSLGGRSACMSCSNTLNWYELIPFFSFLALGGRCRNCKTKISIQYPLVELTTGFIFAILFLKFQDIFFISASVFTITYAYYAFMFSLLVIIATYDLRHKIIPDVFALLFGIFAFISLFFFNVSIFYWHIPTILDFLSGVFIALPFAFFFLISGGRWMGLGDAKLALGLGWFLGFSLALSAIVLAFWIGALAGLGLIIFSKNKNYGMKTEIPFALYLVLGTFLALIFDLHLFGF